VTAKRMFPNSHKGMPALTDSPPMWSVMIPAHDPSEPFLIEALASVLSNDPGRTDMQIEVFDDGSDHVDVKSIVSRFAGDRVAISRSPKRLGAVNSFNKCIDLAKGKWIHLLHADDRVGAGFYERMRGGLDSNPSVGAAFCRFVTMTKDGRYLCRSPLEAPSASVLRGYLERLVLTNRIMASSVVVCRHVYGTLGGFDSDLQHAADWEMWIRIAAHYDLWYEPEVLAFYRRHPGSDTSWRRRSGESVANARRTIEVARKHLPPLRAPTLQAKALTKLWRLAIATAQGFVRDGAIAPALANVREALACAQTADEVERTLSLLGRKEIRSQCRLNETLMKLQVEVWREARSRVATHLASLTGHQLEAAYLGSLGVAHRLVMKSPLATERLTTIERALAAAYRTKQKCDPTARDIGAALAMALYTHQEAHSATSSPADLDSGLAASTTLQTPLVISRGTSRTRLSSPVVGIAVGAYLPRIRGDAFHAHWIALNLQERGYSPIVIAPKDQTDAVPPHDSIPVLEPSAARDCDVVLTYGVSQTTRSVARILLSMKGRPKWLHHPCSTSRSGISLIQGADRVIAMSSWDERLAAATLSDVTKMVRIYPAAHPSRRGRRGFRAEARIAGKFILWVGAWVPAKGPRSLSERFLLFRNRHPSLQTHLVMFGGYGATEYPIQHPFIRIISGNSHSVPGALEECLFVAFNSPPAPRGYDATPLILLEALMHGKTFIAQAGAPLVTEIGSCGIVIRSDRQWLEGVESLILDHQRRRRLEQLCRQAHEQRYNFAQMMTGIEAAIQGLLWNTGGALIR
jgi:glycosyltransferase involved in cell wall biosynthesis